MSQMPEAAGSWPEEGTQYLPGAPMEPVQQPYQAQPQHPYQQQPQYQQQPYPQQGYEQQQYEQQQYAAQQQQYGAPQQQYPAQPPYQEQTAPQPQPGMFGEEEQASVPSEFDHLFRDSPQVDRRSISARGPVVSGPGAAASPGFQQAPAAAQQAQAAQATAVYNPGQPPQGFEDRAPNEYTQSQPFGGGYGAPGGPGGGSGADNRRTPLIIGGVVAVVAAIGLYFGLSGGSGSSGAPEATASTAATHASTETAQQQAKDVYALVRQSKQLRADIGNEVDEMKKCSNTSGIQTDITTTANARQAQADKVAKLDVSKISNGSELVGELQSAWSASAQADADYAKTAADVASNCSASAVNHDSNYAAAGQLSGSATTDKDQAASLWNSTMTNYGQPSITEQDL